LKNARFLVLAFTVFLGTGGCGGAKERPGEDANLDSASSVDTDGARTDLPETTGAEMPRSADADADADTGTNDLTAPDTGPDLVPVDQREDADVDSVPEVSVDAGDAQETGAPSTLCATGVPVPGATVPAGFCIRQYASVVEARTLTAAPNGDIFVGAPTRPTPGGAFDGPGAIVVLADDDRDGKAETHVFLDNVEDVHGLAIGGGFLYFTTADDVWRTPYVNGQRKETGPRESLKMPPSFGQGGRWTHGLARSLGGQLITSRGEYGTCGRQLGGEVTLIGDAAMTVLATHFRNPMYLRCHSQGETCALTELGEDLSSGAREKFILLKPNTNYGYPCCFTANTPTPTDPAAGTCADVAREDASFTLSETPFGFDWEHDSWPEPFRGGVFVALHGSAYSSPYWQGARIVYAPTDPKTHAPVQDWQDFVGGFGLGGTVLDRPSDVVFGPDGRMFFADDQAGHVYWIAPESQLLGP
jgi:glucose/arabinose dehydrogenase